MEEPELEAQQRAPEQALPVLPEREQVSQQELVQALLLELLQEKPLERLAEQPGWVPEPPPAQRQVDLPADWQVVVPSLHPTLALNSCTRSLPGPKPERGLLQRTMTSRA